ncbi:MAG: glycerophosphodiester phosphodiesterase [Planctomycetes bacterium]|nr:glycerophosphodiester phosphodiesterase [Planctomycetota bacterium]
MMMPSPRATCMSTGRDPSWRERLVAHRGLAARFPENTLASVRGALAAGATRVEIDVQLCADSVPILMHDGDLRRLCGDPREVARVPSSELSHLRAAEAGRFGARFASERVATLREFARQIADAGAHAYVELKRESIAHFGAAAVLAAIEAPLSPIEGRCTLISFDFDILALARTRLPHPVGLVLGAGAELCAPHVAALAPSVLFCDDRKLPAGPLHAPAPLCVYEVSSAARARELAERGVELFETFDVERLARELG